MDLIYEVDKINREFGAPGRLLFNLKRRRRKRLDAELWAVTSMLLDAKCKHIGTERNREILLRPVQFAGK